MSHELHPLALEFLNTQITYQEIVLSPPPPEEKPIWVVLFHLSNNPFGYIDVMQEYIDVMKKDYHIFRNAFRQFVDHICELSKIYLETSSAIKGNFRVQTGAWKFDKETVLRALDTDQEYVSIQIGNADKRGNEFKNPLFYDVIDTKSIRTCLVNLSNKIRGKLTVSDNSYVGRLQMNTICRYLKEQVVPILTVLTEISEKQGGNDFIQHLDLIALIKKFKQIKELERQIEIADQTQAENREQRESLMRTSIFNVKSIMPQVKSLVADKQFAQAEADGNAGLSVIGDKPTPVNGGRRTRRHKRSAHKKRSGKRSAHNKRSDKRSSKSRRR